MTIHANRLAGPPGKVSKEVFDRIILPRLGHPDPGVIVGPKHGVDAAAVDLGDGQVLVATTDPLYVIPAFGWERAAWFALHIVASDAATSGLPPRFITVDLNLPRDCSDADFGSFWEAFHAACADLRIAVLTGHTGRYDGCAFPMIGGATVLATGARAALVRPGMARVGDQVIVTKGPAIESCGQLAVLAAVPLAARYGEAFVREAQGLFRQMTIVEDALTAAAVGVGDAGITSLHDATEFGLWGALVEVADTAHCGLLVDQARVPFPDAVRRICTHFDFDPFSASSEGTLVATCRAARAGEVVARLGDKGIAAAVVGELLPLDRGVSVWKDGRSAPLCAPAVDPFWPIFSRHWHPSSPG